MFFPFLFFFKMPSSHNHTSDYESFRYYITVLRTPSPPQAEIPAQSAQGRTQNWLIVCFSSFPSRRYSCPVRQVSTVVKAVKNCVAGRIAGTVRYCSHKRHAFALHVVAVFKRITDILDLPGNP